MMGKKHEARLAGYLYLLVTLIAPFSVLIVPAQLVVLGDPARTAANIVTSDWLLRASIASELLHQVIQVYLVLALYRLFQSVSEGLARQVVIFGALLSVPIVFVNVLNEIAALLLANGTASLGLAKGTADSLTYLFMLLHSQGIIIAQVFWGLWLFPFGLLVVRSGFIPRTLGYLLLVAGSAYLIDTAAALLVPQIAGPIRQVTGLLAICEVPIVFWLVIWGARMPSGEGLSASILASVGSPRLGKWK